MSVSVTFLPARMMEVELTRPLVDIPPARALTGEWYRRARLLVRLHTQPLGVVEVQLNEIGLSGVDCASAIWNELALVINDHLQNDGLRSIAALTAGGLVVDETPRCVRERETLLAEAPPISIIVATRDRPGELAACLGSLLALAYPRYEIIVVDSAPRRHATAGVVQRFDGDIRVRYLREEAPGLARAHNRGLREVYNPIVAFTDDDVIVDRHWLAELMRGFSRSDRVACVTGMILPAELETPPQEWLEQFGGFAKGYAPRVFDLADNRPSSPLYPYAAGAFGSGANMAFKTAVLKSLGGFDPALGAGSAASGGDDLAAFFQIITAGYQLMYQPSALLHHRHRREYLGLRRQAYGYGVGLTAYLMKTLFDKPSRVFDFMRRAPAGLAHLMSPRSPKNRKKQADYPGELTWLERKGMLYGSFAYLRSRRQLRHVRRAPGSMPRLAR